MKKSLLFVLFSLSIIIQGQHNLSKQLQSFDFWTDNLNINDGSNCWIHSNLSYESMGNILNIKADGIDKTEGTASHKISYTMKQIDDYITVNRPYGDHPRDFSYNPKSLSFWIKGNVGNNDEIRILLFEGKDGYTVPNEIYQFYVNQNNPGKPGVLSANEWRKVNIPFSDFSLFYDHGGDGKLNLDRIGQVSIQIINKTKSNHENSFHIDDLRWETKDDFPAESNNILKSIFLPLNVRESESLPQQYAWKNWSVSQWEAEIKRMSDIGLEKVIIQYSQVIYDSQGVYDQETGLGNYNNGASYFTSVNTQATLWIIKSYSTINNILDACIKFKNDYNKDFKVEIGLAHYEPYWNKNTKHYDDQVFYDHMYKHIKASIDDLYKLVNQDKYNSIFYGWYIPQEFNEYYWDTDTKKDLLAAYYVKVSDYIRTKDARPISIAPFFYGYLSTDSLVNWYNQLFHKVNENKKRIDFVYIQDGIGVGEHRIGVDVPQYLSKLKTVFENTGTNFGIVIETFDSYDCQGRDKTDLSGIPKLTRIRRQLTDAMAITGDINKITAFSWADFQTTYPNIDRDSETLYQEYKAYYNSIVQKAGQTRLETKAIEAKPIAYYNPEAIEIVLNVKESSNKKVDITLNDMYGKKVYMKTIPMSDATHTYRFQLGTKLNAGIYFLYIEKLDIKEVIKILVSR